VRGAGDRGIDGPYGNWPHPNLRGLHTRLDIEDHAARSLVAETCRAMGMVLSSDAADLLIVQATASGHAARAIRESKGADLATIVLAGLRASRDLAQALHAGARWWTTVPVTPQQLTAAISRATRGEYGAWHPETCLPRIEPEHLDRIVVECEPLPGTELFELAWLLKRFSRGYDEVAWHNGSILVIPRAPSDQVAGVAERLSILIDGRCTFRLLRPNQLAPAQRFEAAG
jgi:ActR/RegA family two-component response regulator